MRKSEGNKGRRDVTREGRGKEQGKGVRATDEVRVN